MGFGARGIGEAKRPLAGALIVGLVRTAWQGDLFAAGVAAALTATLALAVQTDVIGVPWLAYALWWFAGAFVFPRRREEQEWTA